MNEQQIKIDVLISKLCPNGVKFVNLGDIATYTRGITYGKDDEQTNGPIRVLRANNIDLSSNTLLFENIKQVKDTVKVRPNQKLQKNDILISAASGSKAHVGKVAFVFEDMNYYYGGFMAVLRTDPLLNSRFLFHLLVGDTFSAYLNKSLSSTTINNLTASIMYAYRVPVPPIAIQNEIVGILDRFTELEAVLEAVLEAELEARKTQYEYYRNDYFSSHGVKQEPLGALGKFERGKRFVKSDMVADGVPCIHYGEMYTHYGIWSKKTKSYVSEDVAVKLRFAKKNDVIIVGAGETIEDIGRGVAWLGEEDVVIHDACFKFTSNLNPKYVSYFLRTNHFHSQIKRNVSSGKISAINSSALEKVTIPVPSPEEQDKIVAILDKLDALVSDISLSLPAELKARSTQYEHYRNKLLTFTGT